MWDFVLQSYSLYIAQHWHDHLNYHHAFLQSAYSQPLYQNQKTIINYSLVYIELHSLSSYFDHGLKTAPFQQREFLLTVYSQTWRGRASGNELLIGDDIPLKTDKVCCSEASNASNTCI